MRAPHQYQLLNTVNAKDAPTPPAARKTLRLHQDWPQAYTKPSQKRASAPAELTSRCSPGRSPACAAQRGAARPVRPSVPPPPPTFRSRPRPAPRKAPNFAAAAAPQPPGRTLRGRCRAPRRGERREGRLRDRLPPAALPHRTARPRTSRAAPRAASPLRRRGGGEPCPRAPRNDPRRGEKGGGGTRRRDGRRDTPNSQKQKGGAGERKTAKRRPGGAERCTAARRPAGAAGAAHAPRPSPLTSRQGQLGGPAAHRDPAGRAALSCAGPGRAVVRAARGREGSAGRRLLT